MSWFSDLTSKAEAFLVNLDQGASDVLQQPNSLLDEVKPFLNSIKQLQKDSSEQTCDTKLPEDDDNITTPIIDTVDSLSTLITRNDNFTTQEQPTSQNTPTTSSYVQHVSKIEEPNQLADVGDDFSNQSLEQSVIEEIKTNDLDCNIKNTGHDQTIASTKSQPAIPRRFPIKTRKSRSHIFNLDDSYPELQTGQSKLETTKSDKVGFNLGADNIRASINKSLQDYASQSIISREPIDLGTTPQTSYTSYYDDQMNVIHNDSTTGDSNTYISKGLRNSSSFSIDVPDDRFHSANSKPTANDYLTSRLMTRNTVKNYCAFYIRQVIDKLANKSNHGGQAFTLSDETRLKLRRAQLSANSYARRLNYNFRSNPKIKYMLILYLLVLQLLVVYVLFFYQSSSSSTPSSLASEIDRQQKLQDRG